MKMERQRKCPGSEQRRVLVEKQKKEKKMKKLLVLFVAVAATITLSAKSKYFFNRAQFQWSSAPETVAAFADEYDVQLTVPFVYKGTVSLKADWAVEPAMEELAMATRQGAKCVINLKSNVPAVMTICQPCIDCYPCDVLDVADKSADGTPQAGIKAKANIKYTGIKPDNKFGQPGWITIWNLYLVTEVNKKAKEVSVSKINLLADENKGLFFTGAKGKNIYVKAASEDKSFQLQLTGAKSDYKFKYYERLLTVDGDWDNEVGNTEKTAYIKSAKALNGSIYFNNNYKDTYTADTTADQVEVLDVAGTVKLTRDSSWTGKAIKSAFAAEIAKEAKNWDDCTVITDAATCEEYFYSVFEDDYFGAAYKKYDVEIVEETAAEFFAAEYDKEDNFSYISEQEEEQEPKE